MAITIYSHTRNFLSLVKFSHTLFSFPFAMIGFFLGMEGNSPNFRLLVLVMLAVLLARNAAMSFNRFADRDIDGRNPRTTGREIPSRIITPRAALAFMIVNALLFIVTAYFINNICFLLSPLALLVILGYSYTKRFTAYSHFVLGLGLALAPIGAYLAVTGSFALLPVLFSAAVLFWVAGFDVIYSLQDADFDTNESLRSMPVKFGSGKALILSAILHSITAATIAVAGIIGNFGTAYWVGAIIFTALLAYQHTIVSPRDLSRLNLAFFTTNGIASIIFASFVIADIYL
jgi:4-hydroxybenzoate polyprenyltransferase